MQSERPDPDALLRKVQSVEPSHGRGRLKIFLGASAGVGKTYAMLSEAQEQKARGVDILVGYVELHGRKETEAILEGLDVLPLRTSEYRGIEVKEFDLDAALVKNPELILVDELAHTNAPGSRHNKRWQDIEELVEAGINVYTTVNVQHLESLNDVVAQITGVIVRETVPDSFVDRADNIEVVDIPPEELQQRLREGKVYVAERVEHALEGFFRKGNLLALRELALRRAADRVDLEMQSYRQSEGVSGLWPARERVLVCVAPNKLGEKVVRAAARMGTASHAQLYAISVESARQTNRTEEEHEQGRRALRLAESLGMETVTLGGRDIVEEILNYARQRNINHIVVGKPIKPRWREVLYGSVVDEMVRRSGEIDVHVITAQPEKGDSPRRSVPVQDASLKGYAWSVAITAAACAVCSVMYGHMDATNLVMVFLLGVAIIASRFGPREALLSSLLSVVAFDYAFVPPRWTFAVSDTQYLVTFAIMLAVALLISSLAQQLRSEATNSAERERRTNALYSLSKELARQRGKREIARVAQAELTAVFAGQFAILASGAKGLDALAPSESDFESSGSESAVATWTLEHSEAAGRWTTTLPGSKGLYLPIRGSTSTIAVLAYLPPEETTYLGPAQRNLLETFANGIGIALERALLAKEFHEARFQTEREKMRNALLSSISHDLRTPLTAIAGAASTLAEGRGDTKDLAAMIYQESVRLNVQVQNLLDMTRLQSGEAALRLEWNSLEELVGAALERTRGLLEDRSVEVSIPSDLPLLEVDAELITKVIVNLLENAAAHTPPGTAIEIKATLTSEFVRLDVADRGPGIPRGQESAIFERFFQAEDRKGNFGLGLAICRTIMKLHQGKIWVENRRDGSGAVFHVEFPKPRKSPEVPVG